MKPTLRRLLSLLFSVLVLGAVAYGWFERQSLYDWYRLRGYVPPARIAALADSTAMNTYAERVFYVNRPELQNKDAFNNTCSIDEQSIILGCYITGQGIYIYDVADERLNGIHEVTAAHEMLHAVYDRLGSKERQEVDLLTEAFYAASTDERLKETVESYRSRDPSVVPNELHSILGTEVRKLTPELETHYAKYFDNRLATVAFSEQYEGVFTGIKTRIKAIEERLAVLKTEIESSEATLRSEEDAIRAERSRLDGLAAAQEYQEYNAGVGPYNRRVSSFNGLINSYKKLIAEYNTLVEERNALAVEQSDLYHSIDSKYEKL